MASSARSHATPRRPSDRLPSLSSTHSPWPCSCKGKEVIQKAAPRAQSRLAETLLPSWNVQRGRAPRVCYIPPRTERIASEGGRAKTDRGCGPDPELDWGCDMASEKEPERGGQAAPGHGR